MPKMPERNRSITLSSEDASAIEMENELYEKMNKVLMAKRRWYTEINNLVPEIRRLLQEIRELYDWGMIELHKCTELLALRGNKTKNKWTIQKLNSMHKSYARIWKKYFAFKDKLYDVANTMNTEREMLEEHEPQTDKDILKNMTSQELKVTLEILNARNNVVETWKTAIHSLVEESNKQVKPETRDTCNKYYSFINTVCGKK
ncbi:unnamed protein product [Orchesella dallaii]|uniref:Uncharacterized protein n=1 Tax=Orchesella dallaii TaxID=48710 RepID=A0ABP1Q2D6_9HEXA